MGRDGCQEEIYHVPREKCTAYAMQAETAAETRFATGGERARFSLWIENPYANPAAHPASLNAYPVSVNLFLVCKEGTT